MGHQEFNQTEGEELHELMRTLQAEDRELRIFGTCYHRYRFGSAQTEDKVQEFESRHNIRLPSDYRTFLIHVGDGGATRQPVTNGIGINNGPGPGYGLFPLEETIEGCDVSRPFPLMQHPGQDYVEEPENWGDEIPYPGLIQIAYKGCAYFTFLAVNGPTYGTIWDAEISMGWFWTTGATFGEWYRQWRNRLEKYCLPQLRKEWVVAPIQVGMTVQEVVEICGGTWKIEALAEDFRFLSFDHLRTKFELNSENSVKRIVRYSL